MAGIGIIGSTGMHAARADMEEISNNIANVSTVGFKQAKVYFADITANSSGGNMSSGLGVKVSSISQDFSAGQFITTNQSLDVSLSGNGFFIQTDPITAVTSYTRNGHFSLTNDGVISGLSGHIQGYGAVDGVVSTNGQLGDLTIPQTPAPPVASTIATQVLNLSSESTVPTTAPFDANDTSTYNYRVDSTLYDSLGAPVTMTAFYGKTADNIWDVNVTVVDADGNSLLDPASTGVLPGVVTFTAEGVLDPLNPPTNLDALTWTPLDGATAAQPLEIVLTGSTQYASSNQVTTNTANGGPAGMPLAFSIDNDGLVNVNYSNGQTIIQGQLAIATFRAPENLGRVDNMSWVTSNNSGDPVLIDSSGGFNSGTLELSNVDLTEELVLLLNAQHNFQANAEVEQVYNQILQTIEKL